MAVERVDIQSKETKVRRLHSGYSFSTKGSFTLRRQWQRKVFRQEWVTLDPMKVFTWIPVNTFIGSNVTHS